MWLKICGGALLLVIAIVLVRSAKSDVLPLQWTGILLLGGAALLLSRPLLAWLVELGEAWGMGESAKLLLKGLGIAVLTQLCADLCRQTGEGSIATAVEMAGRAELLLLCLPLLRDLVGLAASLLSSLSPSPSLSSQ